MTRALLVTALALACAGVAGAAPKTRAQRPVGAATIAKPRPAPAAAARHDGAHARVTFGQAGVLHAQRDEAAARGRHAEPLTAEEDTAKQIEKLLRGPLRNGVTALYVADARTGEPLFAVNADDPVNPASNVKMISTATALELLGPEFRYTTRVLGPDPVAGAIHGDLYLLGSWDPTLAYADFDELGSQLAARGVHELVGNIVVGRDATRDGIYRAIVPIEVKAGAAGELATATAPAGFDLIVPIVTAKTARGPARAKLTYTATTTQDAGGHLRIGLAISGTIGKGATTIYQLALKERSAAAAHALRAALRAHQIAVTGDVVLAELADFAADASRAGALPVELARHQSATLADIVAHINKWSINWLADRVVMTAAALSRHATPSMELALDAMYGWLARHAHTSKADVVVDTGSGLSYRTRITAHQLVSVVRGAAGFETGADPGLAHAWLDSLSVAGRDGTLTRRFLAPDVRGRIRGKTGTLSTVIALSGVLDIDPARPLAFALVTNGDAPLSHSYVRKAHEQVVGVLCNYLAKTRPPAPAGATPVVHPTLPDELDDAVPDPELDAETAGQR